MTFLNNSAGFGGGNTIFSDVVYQISHNNFNMITFKNCTWIYNSANFSTAVDVSPNVYDSIAGQFPLSTTFHDCHFIGNRNSRHKNTTKFYFRSGTVMITILLVEFSGETIFADNVGTALHVVATRVAFGHQSNVTFTNNSGDEGGAIALAGMATLVFNSYCREPMVVLLLVLLLWCSLACVAAISNGAANTITVLSDGNKTNCSTNSSGTFCYSLSYAMNHLITDNTTVLLASPKIDVLDRINVSNVSNIALRGLGIDKTIVCYYQFGIRFWNISGL